MRLKDKVALITGGGTGIGFAMAGKFVEEGAYVYITGRREAVLKEAAEKIGKNVGYMTADVGSREDMDRVAEMIRREHGHVDIVVANAGVGRYVSLTDVTAEEFDRVMHTNVLGSYFTVQACLPIMPEGSTIILNTSVTASLGLKDFSLYIAAKSAENWAAARKKKKNVRHTAQR